MKNLKMTTAIMALTVFAAPIAFDNTKGWKKDADGKLEVDGNGNPIYINTSGQEQVVQETTIASLNAEAMKHRTEKEALEARVIELNKTVETFKDIDPTKAKEALETIKNIDAKALIDAGEAEKVRTDAIADVTKNYQEKLDEAEANNAKLQSNLDNMVVQNSFTGSKFISDNIALPADVVQSTFGGNFKIEDGKMVAYDATGTKILSKEKMGEPASFDEAMSILVESRTDKDIFYKPDDQRGSNSNGKGGNQGTGRSMKRSDFDEIAKTQPHKASEIAQSVQKGEMTITD